MATISTVLFSTRTILRRKGNGARSQEFKVHSEGAKKTPRLERVKKLVPVGRVLLFGPVASNLRESRAASDLRARVLITLPASRRSSFRVQRAPQSEPSR